MRKPFMSYAAVLLVVAIVMTLSLLGLPLPGAAVDSAVASSGSGWVDQSPVPGGEDLLAVDAVSADVAWAVGSNHTIFHTTDGGGYWEAQDSGLTNTLVKLTCVSAVDDQTVWVGGIDGTDLSPVLLKTTDGGENWVLQEAAMSGFESPNNQSVAISGLSAPDADTVWISINYISTGIAPFGYFYDTEIWLTTDAGANWTMRLNSTTPAMINEVYAVNDQVAWAAGGTYFANPYPTVLVTSDGGSTWAYRYLDFFSDPKYRIRDVWAADALNGWAVYGQVATPDGGVKRTSDGGATWLTQPAEPGVLPSALAAVDINTLWVVGTSGKIYKTIDGGATWIIQDSGVTATLNDVCAVDVDTAWAVGAGGVILKTEGGGGGAPLIYGIQPTSGASGGIATINGYNFWDSQGSSDVSFGGVQATDYTSWSDKQIVVEVPAGVTGEVAVTVTTPQGTSNPVAFTVNAPLQVTSITPTQGTQQSLLLDITVGGAGFQTGATMRLEKDAGTINAINVNVASEAQATGTIGLFGVEPGIYDIVVHNPDGQEARLEEAFTVVSACGSGSGTALLMLGLTLGLLSLAGTVRIRRGRKSG